MKHNWQFALSHKPERLAFNYYFEDSEVDTPEKLKQILYSNMIKSFAWRTIPSIAIEDYNFDEREAVITINRN